MNKPPWYPWETFDFVTLARVYGFILETGKYVDTKYHPGISEVEGMLSIF